MSVHAGGITWHDSSIPPGEDGPVQTVVRWDRISNQVARTTLPTFPDPGPDPLAPGEALRDPLQASGSGVRPQLAPDGRTLYRVTSYGESRGEKLLADDPATDDPVMPSVFRLEGWDLNVTPPRNRWPTTLLTVTAPRNLWPTVVLGRDRRHMEHTFSPSCTAVAVADEGEVVVCRLADGQVLWRCPHGQSGRLFGVSDDGRRVAFQVPGQKLTVLEQDLTAPEKGRPAKPAELVFRCGWENPALSGDGKTVLLDTGDGRVRLLDVARDPALAAPGEAGRLTVVRPGRRHPAANPCVVLGPDGREVGRLEAPAAQRQLFARLAADDRRLLTNRPPSGLEFGGGDDPDEHPEDPNEWDLYDVTAPGVPRRVAGGRGKAVAPPGTPWVVTTTRTGVAWFQAKDIRYLNPTIAVTVRDGLSGEPVREVTAPPGQEQERPGPPVFAPGGGRYAIVTRAARRADPDRGPIWPAGPITLRVREVATGREVWHATVAERGENGWFGGSVFFSPDGRRVFVAYPDKFGQPGACSVWVGRASDGAHERTLRIPAERPGTGMAPYVVGVAADGRLLVTSGDSVMMRGEFRMGGEVQVWDPDTGERTHRLPGHDGRVVWADVTPDLRRLFVLAGVEGPARLHV
ncbi:MAG: hypothetical protein K2V38_24645, partial [Gemmataceae bacterium]|nr:hypothetical protein [Gemmataceae bacterium]